MSSILTKEEFIQGVTPLCKELALDQFTESHHRAPSELELEHLTHQLVELSVRNIEEQMGRSLRAKNLLKEFLPKLFSKEDSDKILADFTKPLNREESDPNKTPQENLKIPLETLKKCFEVAKHLVQEERFHDAECVFEWILFLNPKFSMAWLDLGLCLQEQGRFNEALQAYATTYFLDPRPLFARAKSVEAYLALKQKADAEAEYAELKILVEQAPDEKWNSILKDLAQKIGELT